MIPSNRTATHPGIILLKEFLEPLGLTQKPLAKYVGVPVQRVMKLFVVRGALLQKQRGYFQRHYALLQSSG
jgi:plasmid maintenance system antidote protein VapI